MASPYLSLRQRRTTSASMAKLSVKLDQERYESECRKVLQAFQTAPSPQSLQMALEAVDRFQQMHSRWIAPVLNKLKPKGNQNIMNNFYRRQSGDTMSVRAAITLGFVYRGQEEGTVVLEGHTMKASTAIEAGMLDAEAAETVAKLAGTNVPAPYVRVDVQEPEQKLEPVDMTSALAAFLKDPTGANKAVLDEALQGHMKTTVIIQH